MFITEELQELLSIVADAGLPGLAGEMAAYALAHPKSSFGDDSEGAVKQEPSLQTARAIEFLRFHVSLAEVHIEEAQIIAGELQEGVFTKIAFVPPIEDGEKDEENREARSLFAQKKRKEEWNEKHRSQTIKALSVLFDQIENIQE